MGGHTIPLPSGSPKETVANARRNPGRTAFADRTMAEPTKSQAPAEADDDLFPPPVRPKSVFSRAAMGTGGVLLILLGIILAILPVVSGFPLIGIGVLMLVAASEHSRRYLNRKEHLLPGSVRKVLRKIVPHE